VHLWQRPVALPVHGGRLAGSAHGHEFLGVVEGLGPQVPWLKCGDMVVAPFVWADNTCDFCANEDRLGGLIHEDAQVA
jgi:threonine dehydrogenase-like Zn-dependent dehydrogenase